MGRKAPSTSAPSLQRPWSFDLGKGHPRQNLGVQGCPEGGPWCRRVAKGWAIQLGEVQQGKGSRSQGGFPPVHSYPWGERPGCLL
jgi:hypothetical protein